VRGVLGWMWVLGVGCTSGPGSEADTGDTTETADSSSSDTDGCLPATPVTNLVDRDSDSDTDRDACADAPTRDDCRARDNCVAVVLAPLLDDGACGRFEYLACVGYDPEAPPDCPDAPAAYEVPGRGCMTQDNWGWCPPPSLGWPTCQGWYSPCPDGTFCPR